MTSFSIITIYFASREYTKPWHYCFVVLAATLAFFNIASGFIVSFVASIFIGYSAIFRDKTFLFRRRNIVESALYVKKKWGTIYGDLGIRYGRNGCEWLQKEGSRQEFLSSIFQLV